MVNKHLEYLELISKQYPLSLKQRCFITILRHYYHRNEKSSSSSLHPNNNPYITSSTSNSSISSLSSSSSSSNISNNGSSHISSSSSTNSLSSSSTTSTINDIIILPVELKEELLHFMMQYRLFNGSGSSKSITSNEFMQSILDPRIRSIDLSSVNSKISNNDACKEILKSCHSIQKLNFSYCYEINDSVLKYVINSTHVDDELSNNNQLSPSKSKSSPLMKLKNKLLKKSSSSPSKSSNNHNHNNNQNNQNNNGQGLNSSQIHPTKNNNNNSNNNTDTVSDEYSSVSSLTLTEERNGLEYLSLRQCVSFGSDTVLRKLLRVCTNLTYLDISSCSKITYKTILTVTHSCTRLMTLSIGSLRDVLDPSRSQVINTFSNLVNLTALDLSHLTNLTNEVLEIILSPASSTSNAFSSSSSIYPLMVSSLKLVQIDIDDESLQMVSERCPTLHSLDVSLCTHVGDQGFIDMASNGLNSLTSLSARLVKSGSGLSELCSLNTMLSRLDIRHTLVDGANLLAIASRLHNLVVLRIDGTPVTDDIVDTFIQNNNKTLVELGVSQCKNITWNVVSMLNVGLKKLFISHCRLSNNLSNNAAINISPIQAITLFKSFLAKCINIVTLDICFTPAINDVMLTELSRSKIASNIDSLFIGGGFHNVSGEVVLNLIKSCPRLRIFSCLSCFNVYNEAVIYALNHCLMLEAIELTDCTGLSNQAIINQLLILDSHLHFHLRFIFFGSSLTNPIDEYSIISKLHGKSTLELLESQQQVTLEDLIDQSWIVL